MGDVTMMRKAFLEHADRLGEKFVDLVEQAGLEGVAVKEHGASQIMLERISDGIEAPTRKFLLGILNHPFVQNRQDENVKALRDFCDEHDLEVSASVTEKVDSSVVVPADDTTVDIPNTEPDPSPSLPEESHPSEDAAPVSDPADVTPAEHGSVDATTESCFSEDPKELARRLRAYAKAEHRALGKLLEQVGIHNRRALDNAIQKDNHALSEEQLARIATNLQINLDYVKAGEDPKLHDKNPKKSRGNGKVDGMSLALPAISPDERQAFFRGRVLKQGVTLVEGTDATILLAAAAKPEDHDWYELWGSHLVSGKKFESFIESVGGTAEKWSEPMKVELLVQLYYRLFPEGSSDR